MMNTKLASVLAATYPDTTEFAPKQVIETAESLGMDKKDAIKYVKSFPSVRRGIYDMASAVVPFRGNAAVAVEPTPEFEEQKLSAKIQSIVNEDVYVPA